MDKSTIAGQRLIKALSTEIEWTKPLEESYYQAIHFLEQLRNKEFNFNYNLLITPLIPQANISPPGVVMTGSLKNIHEFSAFNEAIVASIQLLKSESINLGLICEIHKMVLNGLSENTSYNPGEVRNKGAVIRFNYSKIRHVFPNKEILTELLAKLEKLMQNSSMQPLAKVALSQWLFLNIHPFANGNGRVSIILVALLMLQNNLITSEIANAFTVYLSAYLQISEYGKIMNDSLYTNNWSHWLMYFFDIISLIACELLNRTDSLEHNFQQILTSLNSKREIKITLLLTNYPYINTKIISQECACSVTTARKVLKTLETKKVLSHHFTQQRTKMYASNIITSTLQEPIYMRE